jgi:hypothetical protein
MWCYVSNSAVSYRFDISLECVTLPFVFLSVTRCVCIVKPGWETVCNCSVVPGSGQWRRWYPSVRQASWDRSVSSRRIQQSLWAKIQEGFCHSKDRASWYILIIKVNKMHYFSTLFGKGKELYMFWPVWLSIIRSLNTVFTAIGVCLTSYVDCLLARAGCNSWSR